MLKFSSVTGLAVLCFVLVLSPLDARADWGAQWQTSIPLGSDQKKIEHDFSWRGSARPDLRPGFSFSDLKEASATSSVLRGLDEKVKSASAAGASTQIDRADYRYSFGIPFLSVPFFEWGKRNSSNQFIGFRGINYGLGYQSKNYYEPPIKHKWNSFWQWGTFYLLIPYIGIGTEFTTDNFYFEIATIYIIPYIGCGIHF